MPLPYTPPVVPAFLTYPIDLPINGELVNASVLSADVWEPLIDASEFLKLDLDEDKGVMAALQIKLGLPVIDSSDIALPTYTSLFLLTGLKSHHTALNTLDTGLQGQSISLTNINANVGGSVSSAAPPVYGSGNVVFLDGDTHHEALEKLDDYAAVNRALANTAIADSATSLDFATNVAAKVGTGAELVAPFVYLSTELISNGDTLKETTEFFDAYIAGNRVQTDRNFASIVKGFAASWGLGAEFTFYETFIDTTKADGSTTATLNVQLRQASGDGLQYIAVVPITGGPDGQVALMWEITGTVTFSANLIGSFVPGDFMAVPSQLTYVTPVSGAGSTLVVRAVIAGANSRIHNIAAFTKT